MGIVEMSASGGAMILAAAALRLLARNKLPRRGYVALWAAAILRLLLPVKIASPVSFYGLFPQGTAKIQAPGGIGIEKTAAGVPILAILWLVGMATMGIAFAVPYLRCIRTFRASVPLENGCASDGLAAARVRRRVRVRTLSGLRTPLTYGLLRPVILLPEEAERWDGERLRMVLCHEGIHIRRLDGALKKLAVLALCVHWWNPAVWLMAALLDRDIELACDGAVVERLGPERRAQYARLLIDLKAPGHAAPMVTGFGKNVTEARILGVMGHRRATKMATVLVAFLLIAVVAVFAATAQPPEAAPAGAAQMAASGSGSAAGYDEPPENPLYTDKNQVEFRNGTKKITILAVNASGEYVPVHEISLEGDGQ